ncbi:MAG: transposase [Candidatus Paceibacterota bacterium]
MRKFFKFRLYPTHAQVTSLNTTLEICRQVYNKTLDIRKTAYETEKKSIFLYDTQKLLTQWKKTNTHWNTVYSQLLTNVQMRVDLAYKAFFRRVKAKQNPGFPRFKGKNRYDSFIYPQANTCGAFIEDTGIRLSKIGTVSAVFHRPILGKVKTITIRHTPTNKWYATISVEVDPVRLPHEDKSVGIDLGLEKFATLSDGTIIQNPRFFKKSENRLARVQRKFSKTKKGSKERRHLRKSVSKIYEKISNQRKDFAHKLSNALVNKYGTIVFEDLNIKGMVQGGHLAKSIHDVAWNMLVQYTSYKAEEAGRNVVLVDPKNTSKKCSKCGNIKEDLELKDRTYTCARCGLVLDRDFNASINILALGLQRRGRGAPSRRADLST